MCVHRIGNPAVITIEKIGENLPLISRVLSYEFRFEFHTSSGYVDLLSGLTNGNIAGQYVILTIRNAVMRSGLFGRGFWSRY